MCCSRRRSAPTTSEACFARPDFLELRRQVARGEASPQSLAAAEEAAIAEAVKLQERVGLKFATDGEFRRRSYHSFFYRQLGDVSIDTVGGEDGAGAASAVAQPPVA